MPGIGSLRRREVQVLKLLGTKKAFNEIAADLGITRRTLDSYMDSIKTVLEVRGTREDLIARAKFLGFNFDPDS